MRICRSILSPLCKGAWWLMIVAVNVPAHELKASLAAAETNIASYLEWFGFSDLAEKVPPSADHWLFWALILILLIYVIWKFVVRPILDAQAIETNPANGWRVARAIMRARTMDKVYELFMDYEAVEPSAKAHELEVLAAYGLRNHRTSTEEGGWVLANMEEQAELRGLGGRKPLLEVYSRLERDFPNPWWTRIWRKAKKYSVTANAVSWSFGVPDISRDGVTLKKAPTFRRNPVEWMRQKLKRMSGSQ